MRTKNNQLALPDDEAAASSASRFLCAATSVRKARRGYVISPDMEFRSTNLWNWPRILSTKVRWSAWGMPLVLASLSSMLLMAGLLAYGYYECDQYDIIMFDVARIVKGLPPAECIDMPEEMWRRIPACLGPRDIMGENY